MRAHNSVRMRGCKYFCAQACIFCAQRHERLPVTPLPLCAFVSHALLSAAPAKEITGGIWYRDQSLDESFVEHVAKTVLAHYSSQVRVLRFRRE